MEVSGAVFAKVQPYFSSKPGGSKQLRGRDVNVMAKATVQPITFRDEGHLKYYSSRCAAASQANNQKPETSNKKAVKLLKSLSKDLLLLSPHDDSITEAAKVLMTHLEQLQTEEEEEEELKKKKKKTEEKELKKKKKAEKAKIKASRMRTVISTKMLDSESSSSSSSESSDSDCEDLVDMSCFRNEPATVTVAAPLPGQLQQPTQTQATSTSHDSKLTSVVTGFTNNNPAVSQMKASSGGGGEAIRSTTNCSKVGSGCSVSGLSVTQGMSARRIEVCMGNKCKKSGSEALLQEFAKVVDGVQGGAVDVVGCKCMGKCRDGPNVRVCNSVGKGFEDSVRTPSNPLCIGVGLEDVGAIVTNFLVDDSNNLALTPVGS